MGDDYKDIRMNGKVLVYDVFNAGNYSYISNANVASLSARWFRSLHIRLT